MTAWLPARLKGPSGLLKVPPNYHLPGRGHGGMCFKMDLRCDSHSHSARLSLSLSPFFLLSSCSFLFNGSHMSGKGPWRRGNHVRSARAASPGVRSQCSAHSTRSRLCAGPPVCRPTCPHRTITSSLVPVTLAGGGGGGGSAASRSRYCSHASTVETEPPETAVIASLRIFLWARRVCN